MGQSLEEGGDSAKLRHEEAAKLVSISHKEIHEKTSNTSKIITSLVAGAIAGGIAKTVIAPLDRTKINFQISSDRQYSFRGAIRFLIRTVKDHGTLALWRGNTATMMRIAPYAAVQYASHEQIKQMLHPSNPRELPPLKRVLAGSLAGVTAQSATYPLDLARARMAVTAKAEYKNLWQVFKHMHVTEGKSWSRTIRLSYHGFFPTICGVIPYAGVSFGVYETLKLNHNSIESMVKSDPSGRKEPPPLFRFCYGALAGLCGQSASYPLDIVRRRMQTAGVTQTMHIYYSVMATITFIWKTEGIRRGFYKGLSMNWIKGPVAVGISFTVFDYIQAGLRYFIIRDSNR